jgi:hypothetical protein
VSISVYSWFFFFAWVAAILRRYLLFKSVLAPCREASSFGFMVAPGSRHFCSRFQQNQIENLIL